MKAWLPIVALVVVGCGKKQRAAPEGLPPFTYGEAADRAISFQDKSGFVVTHGSDGQDKNQGDSLIFTGLLLSSLDCGRGEPARDALLAMPGKLWRHPSIPDQEVSLDGALGLYLGVAYRIKKCGEGNLWAPFLARHRDAAAPSLPPFFDYVRDRLFQEAGIAGAPEDKRKALEEEMGAWAFGVKLSKSACYRMNLALMALQTLELLGDNVGGGSFCANTKGMDLPTVDQWCGREGAADYLASYQENQWQYRHQRCPAWEDPDGDGDDQPGIDYLVAFSMLHGIQ